MYVTLYPDELTDAIVPIAHQAVKLISQIAGLGDIDAIDDPIEVVDGDQHAVTAIVALVDLLYDAPSGVGVDLATFLRDVVSILETD